MTYMADHDDRLLFVPLGGSGEIGMNLNLYGHKGRWLMVDLGMTFAGDQVPGVDLIFPRVDFIKQERDQLEGLVLTHGHEDHIGAVPYLWKELRCPIYATPFTAALVRDKLAEAGLLKEVPLYEVAAGETLELGPFKARYVPLAHSIAEGHGIAIETGQGTLFHTGDWKLDDRPLIGPANPETPLTELGDKGVLAMIGDSTNVFNAHESGSEAAVRESLVDLAQTVEKRLVITTFASNVARLETIGAVAKATGRHLCLIGRSMKRILQAGQQTGYFTDMPPLIDEEDVADLRREKVLIACTGCQGEYRAALARIARGEHRNISLSEGDTVVFSSKIIPGNELGLGALFNGLALQGVETVTEKDAFIHVSGHPGRAELARMYEWVRPKLAIPVHGEPRHLLRHARFAREQGVEQAIVPHNGDVIRIAPDGLEKVGEVTHGRLALDGKVVVPLDGYSIVERRRIAQNGLISVSLVIDDAGEMMAEPLLAPQGVPGLDDALYDALLEQTETMLDKLGAKRRLDDGQVEEATRIALRRVCRRALDRNPVVDVLITREQDLYGD
ncbi:ribonuclease J [Yunchengibacter salinarum]|uniref:ribonuclease J n=1 Tax=Yunchengibacter salinarum TaxID=3133399 RepID=UPI0035B5DDA3